MFSKIKKGEKIILVTEKNEKTLYSIKVISRVTPKTVVTQNGMRFKREDGLPMGKKGLAVSDYNYILPVTEKLKNLVVETDEMKSLVIRFNSFNFSCLSLDKLRRILKIIRE